MIPKRQLLLLRDHLAVCRLEPTAELPSWASRGDFSSITRTHDELSIVCPEASVPTDVRAERGWRCFRVAGTMDFSLVGVLASLTTPLAEANIGIYDLLKRLPPASEPVGDESKRESVTSTAEPVQSIHGATRRVYWLQMTPDPCPPDLPLLAQYFGIDMDTNEVFVHGRSAELTLEQQLHAINENAAFFANPTEIGGSQTPFVSINHIIELSIDLSQILILEQLKRVVLGAYEGS